MQIRKKNNIRILSFEDSYSGYTVPIERECPKLELKQIQRHSPPLPLPPRTIRKVENKSFFHPFYK